MPNIEAGLGQRKAVVWNDNFPFAIVSRGSLIHIKEKLWNIVQNVVKHMMKLHNYIVMAVKLSLMLKSLGID